MPDKKLTDAEIVKALECCSERIDYEGNEDTCCSCSLITDNNCTCTLAKLSLDLINRLKEQIKAGDKIYEDTCNKFDIDLKTVNEKLKTAKAENERLKNAYKQCAWERDIFAEDMTQEIKKDCSYLMLDIKTIKAEAYKKFAKRSKEKAYTYSDITGYQSTVVDVNEIDGVYEKLVGDKP